jgi:flagellar basal-body rod modification protein FlgD
MSASTNPKGSSSNSGSSATSTSSSNLNISSADFLQLITTQMQAQNPLQPSDPTQFLTQLEQMSQVSSLQSMQTSLGTLSTSLQSAQAANGASLLGRTILSPSATGNLDATSDPVTGAVIAPTGATRVTITITDKNGAVVNTFQVAPASTGLTNFSWDGKDSSGNPAAAGQYTIGATATVAKVDQKLTPLVSSKVQSVTIDPNTQALDLNTDNGIIPLTNVISVL